MKGDTRAPEKVSHTKAITTQQTHPFHQGRSDSVLATASMISVAKILGICCSFKREDWNSLCHPQITNYFTQDSLVWLDEWQWRENISLPMTVSLLLLLGECLCDGNWAVSWWPQPRYPEDLENGWDTLITREQPGQKAIMSLHKLQVHGYTWFDAKVDSGLKYYDPSMAFPLQLVLISSVSSLLWRLSSLSGRNPAQHTGASILFPIKVSEHLTGSHVHLRTWTVA